MLTLADTVAFQRPFRSARTVTAGMNPVTSARCSVRTTSAPGSAAPESWNGTPPNTAVVGPCNVVPTALTSAGVPARPCETPYTR